MAVKLSIPNPGVLVGSSSAGARWSRKEMVPLSSASVWPRHEPHVQCWAPALGNDMKVLGCCWRRQPSWWGAGRHVLGGAAEGSGPVWLGAKADEGQPLGFLPIPEQEHGEARCCALLPGIQGQDVWEWLKAAPGEVQTRHEGTFLYQEGGQTLEQVSWRGSWCPKYWRDIWAITLITNFDFWSALEKSGSCTRWFLQVSSNWNSPFYLKPFGWVQILVLKCPSILFVFHK